jgi:hypothetical protein
MGNVFTQKIANFSGGLLEDKRQQSSSHFSITKHFDTFTYGTKLLPHYKTETAYSTVSLATLKLVKFLYAQNQTTGIFRLYGLGVKSATTNAKLFRLDIDGTINLDTEDWTACTNGESAVGNRSQNMFFYYKGFIYTFTSTTALNRFDTLEAAVWVDAWQSIATTTNAIQPVHHPSDDIAYFFSDTHIYSYDGSTWTDALTLPTDQQIVAACAFGNYLAVGTITKGNLELRSTVYLWDRNSSLTTLTQRLDFGPGKLTHLANLNNRLIGVMSYYLENSYGLRRGRVYIKQASGEFAVTLNTLTADNDAATGLLAQTFVIKDNKLYFPMSVPLNTDARLGIWAVDEHGRAALDAIEEQATSYDGIYLAGNMWWIAHSANGSVTHTDDDRAYSTTLPSIYETLILSTIYVTNRGAIIENNNVIKKLVGVTAKYEPLPAGGQIILKYRKDGATAWTTIFTDSTATSNGHSSVNIESTGANFPEYYEIEFRIESTGGAVYLGLEYKAETLAKTVYD